jgi:NAD(P)-dependent dehydrogenase (short-subunit alcohol dehydrogenase family)
MDLKGKTAIITGASSGIGLACALAMADQGCTVFSFSIGEPEARHPNIVPISVDVTRSEQIRHGLRRIHAPVDILFNNAGLMRRGTLAENSEEEFDLLFDTHVKGAWLTFTLAYPQLAEEAVVVQMSSRHALYPPTDPGLYGLSKQAAADLAALIARTYPSLRVKTVFPGPVDTALSHSGVAAKTLEDKIKRMHSAQFVAAMILGLITDDRERLVFDPVAWDYRFE